MRNGADEKGKKPFEYEERNEKKNVEMATDSVVRGGRVRDKIHAACGKKCFDLKSFWNVIEFKMRSFSIFQFLVFLSFQL